MILALTGCFRYGDGEQVGYVSAIEEGIIWDRIYIKPSLESTQEDVYIYNRVGIKENAQYFMSSKEPVLVTYDQHLFTLSIYSNDEIVDIARNNQ